MNKITTGAAMVAASALSVIAVAGTAIAAAPTVYNETFEKNTKTVADSADQLQDAITVVRSGKDGNVAPSVNSSQYHAIASRGTDGPFTRFGDYSSAFGGGFTTSVDVYIPSDLPVGDGFEWSSAVNDSNGDHRRDFIFHVQNVDGTVMVGADNNAAPTLFVPENGVPVKSGQWVTLKADFRDDGHGVLAVDMSVDGVHIANLSSSEDIIGDTVGGNRYGWFTLVEADKLAVDNIKLVRS